MRQHLLNTFVFNDFVNIKQLQKIKELPDKTECIRLYSHIINAQIKWLARAKNDPEAASLSAFDPIYPFDELEKRWSDSMNSWISFLQYKTENELAADVQYFANDGSRWEAKLQDIVLQINYHSIHHRAQMQTIIRQQGLLPDPLDYITTVFRRTDIDG